MIGFVLQKIRSGCYPRVPICRVDASFNSISACRLGSLQVFQEQFRLFPFLRVQLKNVFLPLYQHFLQIALSNQPP